MALDNKETAGISLLLLSLVCLGTWPALLRLCSMPAKTAIQTPHTSLLSENSDSGGRSDPPRHLCHVYIDYATAYFFSSALPLALMMVLSSSATDATEETETAAWLGFRRILTACGGGALLSVGNLSMQWAVTVFEAPLTTVLALQSSLTVVLGTSLNFMLEPEKTHHPFTLLTGVLVFLTAIGLASTAQYTYQNGKQHHDEDTITYQHDNFRPYLRHGSSIMGIELEEENHPSNTIATTETVDTNVPYGSNLHHRHEGGEDFLNSNHRNGKLRVIPNGISSTSPNISAHSFQKDNLHNSNNNLNGIVPEDMEYPIPTSSAPPTMVQPWHGIAVAVAGGLCFGFFSPAVNIAVNDPFQWQTQTHTNTQEEAATDNTVAQANLWFALAFWLASCFGNLALLRREQQQAPSQQSFRQVLSAYIYQGGSLWDRKLALAAGSVCAAGNLLQFKGGQELGYATADLVQAYPLISTVWDVFVFGEFRLVRIPSRLFLLLVGMYVAYLSGIFLLAASSMG